MANRDHSLDEKIIKSAREEFLANGFAKASLHTIARNAGTTTGALYTRYENKDALFMSLFGELFEAAKGIASKVERLYMDAAEKRSADEFIYCIRRECEVYQDLLFERFDECKLLFTRSQGSRVHEMLTKMMMEKSRQTALYFRNLSGDESADWDGISMLISSQFHFFSEILENGWDRKKAVSAMKVVELYQEAGWKAIFESIL